MDCQKVKKLIPLLIDNELQPLETQLVGAHLKVCPHCQKELQLYEKSWDMLSGLKEIEPAPGYISRFWTRVAAETSWHEGIVVGLRGFFAKRELVSVLAAISIIVIIGVFSFKNYFSTQEFETALTKLNPEEFELVTNIGLIQNLEFIENLEFLEDLDILEDLDSWES